MLKPVALRTKDSIQTDFLSADRGLEPRARPALFGQLVDHLGYLFVVHAEDVEVLFFSIWQTVFAKVLLGKDYHLLFLEDSFAVRAHFSRDDSCNFWTAAPFDLQARFAVDILVIGTHQDVFEAPRTVGRAGSAFFAPFRYEFL